MKLFIDIDNTILEHSGFYSPETEQRIHSTIGKFPEENADAIKMMYESSICRNPDIIKSLFNLGDVYFLTKYLAVEYEHHKQVKMASVLGITHDELMRKKDKNNIPKYIYLSGHESKVDVVKEVFKTDDISDFYLLDDYSANIIDWENNGGIALKYYNEYNSPTHPLQGVVISNFDVFKPFIEKRSIKNLLVSCDDIYILDLFLKMFNKTDDYLILDILKEVYKDLLETFEIEKIDLKNKYDVKNFLIEYFNFKNNINETYWDNIFQVYNENNDKKLLLNASFDVDFKMFDSFVNDQSVSVKIVDHKYKKNKKIYDVYLTLGAPSLIDTVDKNINNLINILNLFIKAGDR